MHEEWTDRLSDYLDGELAPAEHREVESHLATCQQCAAVLAELRQVVERARALTPRPPQEDLWAGVAARIEATQPPTGLLPFRRSDASAGARRLSFTLPQLAAAAVLLMAVSAGAAWTVAHRSAGAPAAAATGDGVATALPAAAPEAQARGGAPAAVDRATDDGQLATVSFADPQYDAAVAELETAVKKGRGRLDAGTIAIVEHNLQIIDQAIDQARQALAADPANNYLSSHLFEARRRKLDLLRRAAALTTESD